MVYAVVPGSRPVAVGWTFAAVAVGYQTNLAGWAVAVEVALGSVESTAEWLVRVEMTK